MQLCILNVLLKMFLLFFSIDILVHWVLHTVPNVWHSRELYLDNHKEKQLNKIIYEIHGKKQ